MNNYLLFYKKLLNYGGAEELLLKHYNYLIDKNKICTIVTFKNSLNLNKKINIIEVSNIFGLIYFISKNRFNKIFASSGHIEIFAASILTFNKYYYFIHHPSSMSFNEYDKYAFNNLKKLKKFLNPKYFNLFTKLKNKIKSFDQIKINFRFILSLMALRYAKQTFVLSEYAKKEKKILYNISSNVASGAISKIHPFKKR